MRSELYRGSENSAKLILLFAGWSARSQSLQHLQLPDDTDLCICYDYRDLAFDEDLSRYAAVDVVAWSLGVWVADRIIPSLHANFGKLVAINGTVDPVDDRCGIPEEVFRLTLDNVTEDGVYRFNRRMCGSKAALLWYETLPKRDVAELKQELQYLYDSVTTLPSVSHLAWTKAYVSDEDKIFPPENMEHSWTRLAVPTEHIKAPHYPFKTWTKWTEILK